MNPEFIKGECPKSKIRVKTWKAGFSIKCMTAKVVHTIVSTPYDETHFQITKANFCKDCSQINKSKEMNKDGTKTR